MDLGRVMGARHTPRHSSKRDAREKRAEPSSGRTTCSVSHCAKHRGTSTSDQQRSWTDGPLKKYNSKKEFSPSRGSVFHGSSSGHRWSYPCHKNGRRPPGRSAMRRRRGKPSGTVPKATGILTLLDMHRTTGCGDLPTTWPESFWAF